MESLSYDEKVRSWRLLEAAKCGNLEMLKKTAYGLGRGKGLKETIASIHDKIGQTALHLAAGEGHVEICEYLIEELGFDRDLKTSSEKGLERTPLICSTLHGSVSTMEYLIKKGADLNARDLLGLTPLHTAVIFDKLEALRVLLASDGAEVDVLHPLGTPLILATAKNDDTMLNLLLDHKADPNMNYTKMMYHQLITPLTVSVLNVSLKCTQLLIMAGADVNKQPVLDMALGSIDLLNYLLQYGADPNIPNRYGKLPIEVAAIRGLREVVEILFPLTSPIKTVPDWTIEGLFKYVESGSSINMI